MAKYVVPPKGSVVVRCKKCDTLYVPEDMSHFNGYTFFERCPICECNSNTYDNTIPIWKYNLLRFFRCGVKQDDYEIIQKMLDNNKQEKQNKDEQKYKIKIRKY